MTMVDPPIGAVRAAVTIALAEDLTPLGDLSAALVSPQSRAEARFVARVEGVVAGRSCVTETFAQVDSALACDWSVADGDRVARGTVLATVTGPLASVLTAERTALNFLCHLSGVATATRAFVDAAAPLRVWDTRKTTPGLRALEKAAVRAGGGRNHRGNLSDWVMFKDNHLTALGIEAGVAAARDAWPGRTVHVECDRAEQVEQALAAGADALLLDNMTLMRFGPASPRLTATPLTPVPAGRCWRSPAGSPWPPSPATPTPVPTWCPPAPSPSRPRRSTWASTSTSTDGGFAGEGNPTFASELVRTADAAVFARGHDFVELPRARGLRKLCPLPIPRARFARNPSPSGRRVVQVLRGSRSRPWPQGDRSRQVARTA